MASRILPDPHYSFTLLPEPPADYAPVLIDDRIRVVTLTRALARAGLRLSYSVVKRALVIEECQS